MSRRNHDLLAISIVLIAILTMLLRAGAANAQTSGGRISGVILDGTGAVVPGATVLARNTETGVEQTVQSNGDGTYVLYPLPPGVYDITAQMAGFQVEHLNSIRVEVAAVLLRDIRLQVGSVGQQTTVTAESPLLVTESPSVESEIIRDQVNWLPLNGRDFNQLVLLTAGAIDNNAYAGHDFGAVAVNGNRAYSNSYLIDGTPNNDVFLARAGAAASVDVIQEFKVISGVAPAEYGQAGTQVTIVTRSGSNHFHGSLFEYHRDTTWQASNPFDPGAAQPFDRNQFGGSIGGPIRRNHTFFFFNYEGNRQNQTVTQVGTVPLAAFWSGDFSSLLARNIALRDPLTTGRPVFPGNIIPVTRLNPAALALRPYWPNPNQSGLSNNLVQQEGSTATGDQFTIRVDHTLPHNQTLMLRYTQAGTNSFSPAIAGDGSNGLLSPRHNYNGTIGWTAPFGAALVNELRLGYAYLTQRNGYPTGGMPTTQSAGLIGFPAADGTRPGAPKIVFNGNDAFTPLGYGPNASFGQADADQTSKTMNVADTVTYVVGKHTLKAGFEYRNLNLPSLLQPNSSGTITFVSSTGVNSTGYTLGDFLLGLPASSQQIIPMAKDLLKEQEFAAYAQDDWRAARNLTLTLGVRYEVPLTPLEDKNRLALFDPANGAIVVASDNGKLPTDQYLPALVARLTDASGNWKIPLLSDQQAGYYPRRLIEQHYRYFGPRFGFAYTPFGSSKLVLRGGYGIFYSRYPVQYLEQTLAVNPPFAGTFNYNHSISNGTPAITLANPFGGVANASIAPGGLVQNFILPDNQQWNVTVERAIGWATVFSLGYVGNKGTHLFRSVNGNGAYIDPTTNTLVRQYSAAYGTAAINVRRTDGTSIYNSMRTSFRRQTRRGLVFQGSWTWAKGLDDVGPSVNTSFLDVQNLGRDRADSDYVRRHMIQINATYELPFGRGHALGSAAPRWLDALIGGWRLSGLYTLTSGIPFTPTFTAAGGLANNRPDVVYGVRANLPPDQRTVHRWFNPAAFATVPATDPVTGLPRFGNAGRNILIGPRTNYADGGLSKSVPVHESWLLTFRMEMFNAFNHPNYDLPDANISNINTVATINDIVRPMRQAQFALRLDF
jgi:hypothetical protein